MQETAFSSQLYIYIYIYMCQYIYIYIILLGSVFYEVFGRRKLGRNETLGRQSHSIGPESHKMGPKTSYKWGYITFKWPYKWVPGVKIHPTYRDYNSIYSWKGSTSAFSLAILRNRPLFSWKSPLLSLEPRKLTAKGTWKSPHLQRKIIFQTSIIV